MSNKNNSARVVDQKEALSNYLADLLAEVPDHVEPVLQPVETKTTEKVQETSYAEPVVRMPLPTVAPPAPPEVVPEPEISPVEVVEKVQESRPEADKEPVSEKMERIVPEWGAERFQCLLFDVGGLKLAVPLVKLNGVIPWNNDLTEMPGHSSIFLGLLRHLGQNVKVIDTARLVLPERQGADLAIPEERLRNIILIDESRWGLACDGIGEVLTLSPEDVKWRTAQGSRPWLAGTVMEHLCALLDVDAFSERLLTGPDELKLP